MSCRVPSPWSLDRTGGTPPGVLRACAYRLLERLAGLHRLRGVYASRPAGLDAAGFVRWGLEALGTPVLLPDPDRRRIPAAGAVVAAANHPFGAIEGMAVVAALLQVRPDVRILGNYLLGRIPELRPMVLPVDPFGGAGAGARSLAGLRGAVAWLQSGGALVTFPAGEVAHLRRGTLRVEDPPWSSAVARLASLAGCPVLPVFVPGRNGPLFQAAGLLHPRLRTALLPRALLSRQGRPVEMRIGHPIPPASLAPLPDDVSRTRFVRDRVEILAARPPAPGAVQPRATPARARPLAGAVPPDRLEREVASLPAESLLVEADTQQVYLADAPSIPSVLREIGRLREISFRAAGEGTGREIDLDRFDEIYRHIFLWDRSRREVVGAYRVGATDRLLAAGGTGALYTSTLFRFRRRLFREMGPALEMGRSFVRPERQRGYAPLLLLWRGIGELVVREPRYATLFGPVSISAAYRHAAQRLLVAFLEQGRYTHPWSVWVRPRTPFRPGRGPGPVAPRDLEEVAALLREIQDDGRSVPILLKQYLKLEGRLLGLNRDPDFSDVLDVLLLVDLTRVEGRVLERYMGPDGARSFLAFHRSAGARAG